jgi:hypothetical protein
MGQNQNNMTARKTFQGAWEISELVGYVLITRQYIGYTKKEAISAFREDKKNLFKPIAAK